MLHKTKLIVLRAIKYGDTSLVVTAFTEKFGIQTYMVSGVRTLKKTGSKAALYQPGAILQAEVYHNGQKNMQRIREAEWAHLYQMVLSDVIKNSIALYMVELLHKTLKQPEQNESLFAYCEDALTQLDKSSPAVSSNFALYFSLHLAGFLGIQISPMPTNLANQKNIFWDMEEGLFMAEQPTHPHFIDGENAKLTAELLMAMQPNELEQIKLNRQRRRELLQYYLTFYALHLPEFGQMKTLKVLYEIL